MARGDAGHIGLGGSLRETFENALDGIRLFDAADDFCAPVTNGPISVHTDPEYPLQRFSRELRTEAFISLPLRHMTPPSV